MKVCPTCNRTYSDPTFSFCLEDGSLLSAPVDDETETVLRSTEPNVKNQETARIAQITEPVVAINIAQQYPNVRNAEDLYQCTRGLWRLNKTRAEKAKFAFSVFRGIIKEVYVIDFWEPADIPSRKHWEETLKMQGIEINPAVNDGRYQFVGRLADNQVRQEFIGAKMPVLHAQNPIRYFNC